MTAVIQSDRYYEGAILETAERGLFNSIALRATALG
jgi:hypothetical protein